MSTGTKTISKQFEFFFVLTQPRVEIKTIHPQLLLQGQFLQRSSPAYNKDLGYHCSAQISPAIRTKTNHWHMFKQTLGPAYESSSTLDKYLSYLHLSHNEKEFIRRNEVYYFSEEKGKRDTFKKECIQN